MCGPLSALRIAALHQTRFSTDTILANHSVSPQGIPLREVIAILEQLGISAKAVHCRSKDLTRLNVPCILVTHENQHCLVLEAIDSRQQHARIWEPSTMQTSRISLASLEELWSDRAILFSTNQQTIDRLGNLILSIATASLIIIAIRWAPSNQILLFFVDEVRKLGLRIATIFVR